MWPRRSRLSEQKIYPLIDLIDTHPPLVVVLRRSERGSKYAKCAFTDGDVDFCLALPSLVFQSTVHLMISPLVPRGHGNPKNPGPDRRQQLIGPLFICFALCTYFLEIPNVALNTGVVLRNPGADLSTLQGQPSIFVRDKNQRVPNHTWIRGVQVGLFEISFWSPAIPRQLASYRIPRAAPDHDSMRYLYPYRYG